MAASGSRNIPPSENESGVTLTIPISFVTTASRLRACSRSGYAQLPGDGVPPERADTQSRSANQRCDLSGREAPHRPAPSTRIPAGIPRPRPRDRPRALALRPFRLRCRLDLRRLILVDEDLLLGLAGQQGNELLGVDRLPLEQDLRDRVELLATVGEQVLGGLVGSLDDAADLVVDLPRDLVGVVGFGAEFAAEEGLTAIVAEDARAEPLGQAEAH